MDWTNGAAFLGKIVPRKQVVKAKKKVRPDRPPDAVIEKMAEQDRMLRVFLEAQEARLASLEERHPALTKWLDTLIKEVKVSRMTRPGTLDWDVEETIAHLRLASLPREARQEALAQFGYFMGRVSQRIYGHKLYDPLPPGLGGYLSDLEVARKALEL